MIRVKIIVEGQTEELFVNKVMANHLMSRQIYLYPWVVGKPGSKGGVPKWTKAKRDILITLKQDRECICTIMFDYYGMPSCWPGRREATGKLPTRASQIVQEAIATDIQQELGTSFNAGRFLPYVQMHEFEALLFSGPEILARTLGRLDLTDDFTTIRQQFPNPEQIDDGPHTAPSKRIIQLCEAYSKGTDGALAAQNIGLDAIRVQCPNFNNWLSAIESLAAH
ncbi:MAG TPA: DUF4276 family protein [Sedimentisphaerales bacterium]|nr:DUF4276 family protein [Sedimentisphaerales bacterium]